MEDYGPEVQPCHSHLQPKEFCAVPGIGGCRPNRRSKFECYPSIQLVQAQPCGALVRLFFTVRWFTRMTLMISSLVQASPWERLLRPMFVKRSRYKNQREYRFVVWSEEKPTQSCVDLVASTELIGSLKPPVKIPHSSPGPIPDERLPYSTGVIRGQGSIDCSDKETARLRGDKSASSSR